MARETHCPRNLFSVTQCVLLSCRQPATKVPQRLPVIEPGDLPKGPLACVPAPLRSPPSTPPPPSSSLTLLAVRWTPAVGTRLSPGMLSVFVVTLLFYAGGPFGSKNEMRLSTPRPPTWPTGRWHESFSCFGLFFLHL